MPPAAAGSVVRGADRPFRRYLYFYLARFAATSVVSEGRDT